MMSGKYANWSQLYYMAHIHCEGCYIAPKLGTLATYMASKKMLTSTA